MKGRGYVAKAPNLKWVKMLFARSFPHCPSGGGVGTGEDFVSNAGQCR